LLSLRDAIKKLTVSPSQLASQILGAEGHSESQPVASSGKVNDDKVIEKKGISRYLARRGASPEFRNGARWRFRTSDPYRVKVMLYH
jgi:hypothetical protein